MYSHTILNADKIFQLILKAKDGDKEARNLVILHNMALVKSRVIKWSRGLNKLQDDDLLDYLTAGGVLGLCRAIEKFDPSLGLCFTTYCVHWIDAHIREDLREMSVVRVPHHAYKVQNKELRRKVKAATKTYKQVDNVSIPIIQDEDSPFDYERLKKGLESLSDKEKLLIKMRFIDDMTLESIGKKLKRTHEAIRIRINKILGKLKEVCDE